jgi:hypothetical protein
MKGLEMEALEFRTITLGRVFALKLQRRCKGFQEATINFHLHPSITIAFVHTVAHPLKRKENNSSFDQPVDFSYLGIMPHHTPWNTRMQHTMQIKETEHD